MRLMLGLFLCMASMLQAQDPLPARTFGGVEIREQWIPMRDGVKLAVNLFLPADLQPGERIPAILEYLPYRKDDWSVGRDYSLHSYFVKNRYVVARVDVRGTGRSQGKTPDCEYSDQELRDGEDVIAWLSAQDWSNANVGMMGISWGGFNALQMAMRQPPALKAILAADASDDLFHDDIHYIDGMMHLDEFEISMDLTNALSPAPDFPIDENTLSERFDTPPWFLLYLQHQRDGTFWRRASLAPDYSRIKIPVFLIGGLLDGYRDSVPRMLENLEVPRTAIMGPWPHSFPHDAEPGPAVEWRDLATEWWNRWLKDSHNDVEKWPMLRVFLRNSYEPSLDRKEIPGEWHSTPWPAKVQWKVMQLSADHGLTTKPSPGSHELRYKPSVGVEAGMWWGDLTPDQRDLDRDALIYQTAPLEGRLAILGIPAANLTVQSTAPLANWFVRLEDVAPDGSAELVTGGGLSGAQIRSPETPGPLVPGRTYGIRVPMHFTTWNFPAGHRIRLSVTNALWPMIWPTPYSMKTNLLLGTKHPSELVLPMVDPDELPPVKFAEPAVTGELPGLRTDGELLPGRRSARHDPQKNTTTVSWEGEETDSFPWGTEVTRERLDFVVNDDAPAHASAHGEASIAVKLGHRNLLWSTSLDLHSDERNFYYEYTRELRKDGALLRTRTWRKTVPRDLQ